MMMEIHKPDNKINIQYLEDHYGKSILPLPICDNEIRVGSKPMEDLLFYKKGTSVLKLKESLFETIKYYNLFSSRLIRIDNNKFAIQYCTDGVSINVLPPLNATFDNINIDDIKKMMVHVKTLPGEPLFAVTGIPIKNGILGALSCSHAIGDGISLMIFLFAWGRIIEGKDFPLPSPQRLYKGHPVRSDKINKAFTPPLSELSAEIQNRVKLVDVKTFSKKEYFSDEFLNEIKNKAKSENAEYIISNNQIIISLLLKKYHNQILPDTDTIRIFNPINLRDIHPDIDSMYIGNAFFNSFTEFTKDEIDNMSAYQIAHRLKVSINHARDVNFVKKIAYLSDYGEIEIKEDMFTQYPPSGDMDKDIISSNLTHFNDLESLGLGSNIGAILDIGSTAQTGFTMLKEKSGRIVAQITSRYPFK